MRMAFFKVLTLRQSVLARLAVVALPLLALSACKDGETASGPPPRTVLVTTIEYVREPQTRSLVANIKPRVESELGFRVAGKIAQRRVQIGDPVRAGQVLATLDQTDFQLQAEQAEADAKAASVALDQATGDEDRANDLRRNGWTAQAALDKVRSAAEEARGRVTRTQRTVELTRNAISYTDPAPINRPGS